MKKIFSFQFLLLIIFLLGFLLRVLFINKIRQGLFHDEITIGYDAYSLLLTGKDIYGEKLPILFQSGEYRPPLNSYLLTVFIYFLGLNNFSVRFFYALISSLTVLLIFVFAKKLFNTKIALLSSFLLAISPWHIRFSRRAHEATLGLFFLILALIFFIKYLRNKNFWQFFLSNLFFCLTIFSYFTYYLFTPLFLFIIIFLFRKEIIARKINIAAGFLWFLSFLIMLYAFRTQNAFFRFKNITSLKRDINSNTIIKIVKDYVSVFSPKFLFLNKNSPRIPGGPTKKAPTYKQDLCFFIIGFFWLLRSRKKRIKKILFSWLFLAPFPSSLVGFPESQRALTILPCFIIIVSCGLVNLYEWIVKSIGRKKGINVVKLLIPIFLSIYLIELSFFVQYYVNEFQKEYPGLWGRNWYIAREFLAEHKDKEIFITDSFNALFYRYVFDEKINPEIAQKEINNVYSLEGMPVKKIGNYYFIQSESLNKRQSYKFSKKNFIFVDFFNVGAKGVFNLENCQKEYLKTGSDDLLICKKI